MDVHQSSLVKMCGSAHAILDLLLFFLHFLVVLYVLTAIKDPNIRKPSIATHVDVQQFVLDAAVCTFIIIKRCDHHNMLSIDYTDAISQRLLNSSATAFQAAGVLNTNKINELKLLSLSKNE